MKNTFSRVIIYLSVPAFFFSTPDSSAIFFSLPLAYIGGLRIQESAVVFDWFTWTKGLDPLAAHGAYRLGLRGVDMRVAVDNAGFWVYVLCSTLGTLDRIN